MYGPGVVSLWTRPAEVVGDHAELASEVGYLMLPDVGARPAETVHEHDGRPGAELLDVGTVAVQVDLVHAASADRVEGGQVRPLRGASRGADQCWTSAAVGIVGTADFAFWMCSMSISVSRGCGELLRQPEGVHHHLPVRHHERELRAVLEDGDVLERVAVDDEDVGALALLDRSALVLEPEQLEPCFVEATIASIGEKPMSVTNSSMSFAYWP